jgi:molybdopterin-binding protein
VKVRFRGLAAVTAVARKTATVWVVENDGQWKVLTDHPIQHLMVLRDDAGVPLRVTSPESQPEWLTTFPVVSIVPGDLVAVRLAGARGYDVGRVLRKPTVHEMEVSVGKDTYTIAQGEDVSWRLITLAGRSPSVGRREPFPPGTVMAIKDGGRWAVRIFLRHDRQGFHVVRHPTQTFTKCSHQPVIPLEFRGKWLRCNPQGPPWTPATEGPLRRGDILMVPFPEGEVVGVVEGDPTGKVTRVRCLPPLAGQVVVIPLPRLRDCRRVPPPL